VTPVFPHTFLTATHTSSRGKTFPSHWLDAMWNMTLNTLCASSVQHRRPRTLLSLPPRVSYTGLLSPPSFPELPLSTHPHDPSTCFSGFLTVRMNQKKEIHSNWTPAVLILLSVTWTPTWWLIHMNFRFQRTVGRIREGGLARVSLSHGNVLFLDCLSSNVLPLQVL